MIHLYDNAVIFDEIPLQQEKPEPVFKRKVSYIASILFVYAFLEVNIIALSAVNVASLAKYLLNSNTNSRRDSYDDSNPSSYPSYPLSYLTTPIYYSTNPPSYPSNITNYPVNIVQTAKSTRNLIIVLIILTIIGIITDVIYGLRSKIKYFLHLNCLPIVVIIKYCS